MTRWPYKHFAATGKPVQRFILGNELNCGCTPDKPQMTAAEYSSRFNLITDALRAENPAVKVGRPGHGLDDRGYIKTFLEGSGSRINSSTTTTTAPGTIRSPTSGSSAA